MSPSTQSVTNFIAQVTTTAIDAKNKLVGFQGDFTFDERVVTFQERAGAESWTHRPAIGTYRGTFCLERDRSGRCAYRPSRLDFTPLSGAGTLFELRMTKATPSASSELNWATGEDRDPIFINTVSDAEAHQRSGWQRHPIGQAQVMQVHALAGCASRLTGISHGF